MSLGMSRRGFLRGSAGVLAAASALRAAEKPSATGLRIAFIGVTGRGKANLKGVQDAGGTISVLCDVDQRNLAQAAADFPEARHYQDFRKMLEAEADRIDGVVVTTPDHTHAVAAMAAMRLGKHVYCEKPLAHDIAEVRTLRDAARRSGVATQMGNGAHASNWLRQHVEWLRAGMVGAVREVHVWTNRPVWPQGMTSPPRPEAPPPQLDWDLWLGPAPERPYSKAYHPFAWRGWWEFGTGALGDMACHLMDPAVWGLELTGNCTVEAESEGATEECAPNWSTIRYDFPANSNRPALRMTWYDGKKGKEQNLPPKPQGLSDRIWEKNLDGGMYVVGERGSAMMAWGGPPILLGDARKFTPPPQSIPRSPGHYREWLEACKGGPVAFANFDYAAGLTETVLLGDLALRLGAKVEWDAQAMKVTNNPRAAALVRRAYRAGWSL